MADPTLHWSKQHVENLRIAWKKIGPGHNMFIFNRDYHTEALKRRTSQNLKEIVRHKIPHLSDLASKILKERG